ncbi:YcgN family cysteine cluster protein [Pseudidiomarina gelatinasegens]|uniref:YcgN family cysteine cluster protein n=1 Tax=Pseudidiomarina gelatinasegens TaxID=2487740 RepID=UPI0030EBFF99
MTTKFWEEKSLQHMTHAEWESLCDGCGKCCLHKLIDEDDAQEVIEYTDVSCRLLDTKTGLCSDYANRKEHVPDCVVITPDNVNKLDYMPTSCAYRRLAEGRGIPSWHPLNHNGSRGPMLAAGMSAAGLVESEDYVEEELELRIVTWPLNDID